MTLNTEVGQQISTFFLASKILEKKNNSNVSTVKVQPVQSNYPLRANSENCSSLFIETKQSDESASNNKARTPAIPLIENFSNEVSRFSKDVVASSEAASSLESLPRGEALRIFVWTDL